MQGPPPVENLPLAQFWQASMDVEAAGEDFPASQLSHVFCEDAPRVPENFPAVHSVHMVAESAPTLSK